MFCSDVERHEFSECKCHYVLTQMPPCVYISTVIGIAIDTIELLGKGIGLLGYPEALFFIAD